MNERIEKLFKHAFPPSLNDSNLVQLSAEKFAELIVRECLNIVEPDVGMACGDEWYTALDGAAQEIREHFGVE